MTIPPEWLDEPITIAEAEEDLSDSMPADAWLAEWRALLGRLAPGDALWRYFGDPCEVSGEGPERRLDEDWHAGIALVRDGEVVDSVAYPRWL